MTGWQSPAEIAINVHSWCRISQILFCTPRDFFKNSISCSIWAFERLFKCLYLNFFFIALNVNKYEMLINWFAYCVVKHIQNILNSVMKWRAMRVQLQDSGDLLLGLFFFLRQFNFHFWDVYAANCSPFVFLHLKTHKEDDFSLRMLQKWLHLNIIRPVRIH